MDSELETADQYRRLSPLAVIAFLGGLLSSLALVSPDFWVVAFLAVAFGLFAIWQIEQKPEQLAGASLARWGLVLAIVLGVAAYARNAVTTRLFNQQAEQTVTAWVDMLSEGQLEDSMQLLTRKASMNLMPAPKSPDAPPPTIQQAHNIMLKNLGEHPVTKHAQQLGNTLRIEPFGEPLAPVAKGSSRQLSAAYRLSGEGGPEMKIAFVVAWPQQKQSGSLALIDQWRVIPEE